MVLSHPRAAVIVRDDCYLRFEYPDGECTFSVDLVDERLADERVTVYFEADDLGAETVLLAAAGVACRLPPPCRGRGAKLTSATRTVITCASTMPAGAEPEG